MSSSLVSSGSGSGIGLQSLVDDGNISGGQNISWLASNHHKGTLTADITALTFTNPAASGWLTWVVSQDSTGGFEVNWSGISLSGNEPVINTLPSSMSIVELYFDGTTYHSKA